MVDKLRSWDSLNLPSLLDSVCVLIRNSMAFCRSPHTLSYQLKLTTAPYPDVYQLFSPRASLGLPSGAPVHFLVTTHYLRAPPPTDASCKCGVQAGSPHLGHSSPRHNPPANIPRAGHKHSAPWTALTCTPHAKVGARISLKTTCKLGTLLPKQNKIVIIINKYTQLHNQFS